MADEKLRHQIIQAYSEGRHEEAFYLSRLFDRQATAQMFLNENIRKKLFEKIFELNENNKRISRKQNTRRYLHPKKTFQHRVSRYLLESIFNI